MHGPKSQQIQHMTKQIFSASFARLFEPAPAPVGLCVILALPTLTGLPYLPLAGLFVATVKLSFAVGRVVFRLVDQKLTEQASCGSRGWINAALRSFVSEMKTAGRWDDTTIFSVSEFGRTVTSNGQGTDHGWAGHQFGGAHQYACGDRGYTGAAQPSLPTESI